MLGRRQLRNSEVDGIRAVVYENHSQDSRYKRFKDICETVSAKYGTGGNNQPLVLEIYEDKEDVDESRRAGGMASIHN